MVKVTVGVYKAFKNSGFGRFHREKTKKSWKHYFYEDYFDDGDWEFGSEWVSGFKAILLKRKQVYKRQFYCFECGAIWERYVPKNTEHIECPNGCD